ncbi:Toll-interacting protein [Dirofilaria immitis]|nr:Toll-interacting protein [Dirofilaria immitis]
MASASTVAHSSSAKLVQNFAAERRKKSLPIFLRLYFLNDYFVFQQVLFSWLISRFLGQLPVDFLRIAIPSPTSIQEQQQQSMVPFYIGDPNLVTQQALCKLNTFSKHFVRKTQCRSSEMIPSLSLSMFCAAEYTWSYFNNSSRSEISKNYGLVRMDPYCCVRVGNAVFETPKSVSGGKTPKWNRVINAYLPYGVESFYLQIYDEKAFTADECIAWVHIILPNGVFGGEIIDDWYQLSGQQGENKEGVINLITSFTPV